MSDYKEIVKESGLEEMLGHGFTYFSRWIHRHNMGNDWDGEPRFSTCGYRLTLSNIEEETNILPYGMRYRQGISCW